MTTIEASPLARRFDFTPRAQRVRLRDAEPYVHGYAWQHSNPTAVVVFVHGLQSHAQWFAEAADLLVDRGLAVYAVDRRGSGSSPGVRGDIERYTEWFEEVAEMVRLARTEYPGVPVHLVGHCFGANIALGCVLTGDTEVETLVMLTPGFHVLPDYTLAEKLRILATTLVAPHSRFRVPQDDALFTHDPDILGWIRNDTLGARSLTARCLWQINRMLGALRRNAGALAIPLLVFEAGRDRLSDNARNRALLGRALGGRCHWLALDAEHFLLAEPCRDDVLDALVRWTGHEEVGRC